MNVLLMEKEMELGNRNFLVQVLKDACHGPILPSSFSRPVLWIKVQEIQEMAHSLLRLAVLFTLLAAAAAGHGGHHGDGGKKHHNPPPKPGCEPPPPPYCKWKGSVCHDPVLVGADGQQFYFHGHKDADFCLVSDSDLHINAHFIGRRREGMQRDFTWVQSLGILFGPHQLYLGANKVATWNGDEDHLTMALDNAPIIIPTEEDAAWEMPAAGVSVSRLTATNSVAVVVEGKFKLLARVVPITEAENVKQNYGITADNCFAHLEINFQFEGLTERVSGVLGQTYAAHHMTLLAKPGQLMPTLGGEASFQASALMAPDCSVSRYGSSAVNQILSNLSPIACSSEDVSSGIGMVCRK